VSNFAQTPLIQSSYGSPTIRRKLGGKYAHIYRVPSECRTEQDAALLTAAEKDLARFKALVLKAVESQQNVDRQQGTVDQLKAAIDADAAMIETAIAVERKRRPDHPISTAERWIAPKP
jgi:multidrug resistance efflux pump